MSEAVRFIIITTPPAETSREIDVVRRLVCQIGRSQAALAYPPHVTLRTGARVPPELIPTFLDAFGAAVGAWEPFPIRTAGIWQTTYLDGEREKFLVGYRVEKSPALAALNERLLRVSTWRASNRLHFEPHLTLAYDDLDLDGYRSIESWREQSPRGLPEGFTWTCDNVGLFYLDEEDWTPYKVWRV